MTRSRWAMLLIGMLLAPLAAGAEEPLGPVETVAQLVPLRAELAHPEEAGAALAELVRLPDPNEPGSGPALAALQALLALPLTPELEAAPGERAVVNLRVEPLPVVLVQVEGRWQVDPVATFRGLVRGVREATGTAARVAEVTDANYPLEVLAEPEPVLLLFWSRNCGVSVVQRPVFQRLADEFAGRAKFGEVSVLDTLELPVLFGVWDTPTVVLVRGGEKAAVYDGPPREADLRAWIGGRLKDG